MRKVDLIKFCVFLIFPLYSLHAQVNYSANDAVIPYDAPFSYGANPGYYPGWQDINLGSIAAGDPAEGLAGAGITAFRPALFEHFLEQWGYDIRLSTFQHYQDLGMKNNVVFIGYPSAEHKEPVEHCQGKQSEVFANLYEPIWDNGENGTPVNDENYYALYLYEMVRRYKPYVKIWEIWNEPDFDYASIAWQPATADGNWWTNNPDPCDYALRAPVFSYIRMLRISWDVIKTLDPDAYIAIGGLGYPSFLDAVLRNTDNPQGGAETSAYPLKGGAYFDVMSFHTYPHIDGSLRQWDNAINGFYYQRHSDAAVRGMLTKRDEFKVILEKYGYNGTTFPQKHYIITESNLPRQAFGEFIGSPEAQRNYLIKALVTCQKEQIHQFHVYNLGDLNTPGGATSEFQLMGLFDHLAGKGPYQQNITDAGKAYATTSWLLNELSYNQTLTQRLTLPQGIKGMAFSGGGEQQPVYVLWAETRNDRTEAASREYTFPAVMGASSLVVKEWDYSETQDSFVVVGNTINLTGDPVFITLSNTLPPGNDPDDAIFRCYPNPYQDTLKIVFELPKEESVSLHIINSKGMVLRKIYDRVRLPEGVFSYDFVNRTGNHLLMIKLQIGGEEYIKKVVRAQRN